MVLHAGIVCYEKTKKGKLVIYNTKTSERITKDVMTVGPGDNNGVDELFKSIQSYFNSGPKGCLCICLGNRYDSEIRKKFIDVGKAFGFTKVGITDWLSADYTDLVSATDLFGKVKTLKGFIWIFCGKTCRVWRKDADKARFVKEMKYEDTVESLEKIKNAHSKTPDLVIYGDKLKPHYERVKDIFGRDKVTVYSELNQENGVLIKARIMGKDEEMKKYSTEILLEQFAELKIGGVPIASAKTWQGLPFNQLIPIDKPDDKTDLEMNSYFKSNKKWLPEAKKFVVKFNIDVNGICSVDFDTGENASNSDVLEKKQGKKYSSNNSLPTDSKPKFQPRAPGQQQTRPRGPPPQPANPQQQNPQGVVRTNLSRTKNSVSMSSVTSTNSTDSNRGGGARGGGAYSRGRGSGNNNGGSGANPTNYANLPQEPIPGYPPNFSPGYAAPMPGYQQNNPMSRDPYGVVNGQMHGNPQMHHAMSSPAQFPQNQQQQPFYGGNPSYPTSPQGFAPPQQMGYQNAPFPPTNPGYPPNAAAAPPYANPQFGYQNFHQQFQNMGGFQAPPPYPGDISSNNFNEKQKQDYQKPAFSLDSSNQPSNSGFPNNQGSEHFMQGNSGKEKGNNNSKKNAKR